MNLKELAKLIKNKKTPDCFYYKNKYYVIDYYDMNGLEMNYGSKQAQKDITIYTPNNRYKNNYKDMSIVLSDKTCYSFYVNYRENEIGE